MKRFSKGFISMVLVVAIVLSAIVVPTKSGAATKYVTVTVSESFNNDEFTEYLNGIKFKKKIVNEEGTISYTMTKSQQKKILKYIKKMFSQENIKKDLPDWCESITINKDFTLFKLYVDKKNYKEDVGLYVLGLMIISNEYQQFAGVNDKDMKFEASIIDQKTKKEIKKIDISDLK